MFQINWKIKAFLYRVLFFLKVERALFFIQKKITKSANINIDKVNENWKYHLKYLQSFNSITVLEFGAGKSLEQNIFFSYQLNDKLFQTVIDVSNMLDIDLFNQASDQVATILKKNRKAFVQSIDGIKKNYNIEYIAPCDIEKIERSGLKFDACISTTTLEHLPVSKLENHLISLKKIVKKNGIISSLIDYSDHYCHTDTKISPLNFLQFNENHWERYNTPYLFQNRLRHQDYRNLFLKMDYEIVKEKKGSIGIPPKTISDKFDTNNKETNILWGHFVLKFK